MTRKIDEYSNEVWDHLFDFVAQPLEEMTIDEVQAELKNSGIDTTEAIVRVREAIATAKARVESQGFQKGNQAREEFIMSCDCKDQNALRPSN